MPIPASWTRITVSGTYLNFDGTPATGTVHFTPKAESLAIDERVVLPTPVVATLDASGSFSVQLPATDDPDLAVTGWAYRVVERVPRGRDPFYIQVPHAGGPINMADVLPLFTPGELSSVLSAPAVLAAQQAAGQAAQSAQDAQDIANSMTGALSAAVVSATSAAAGSATAAANSATAAAGSATSASNSATAAGNSATAAGTSATAAGNSAAAAAQSAIDAQIAAGTHVNDIGVAGQQGFGVGTCPALPVGFTEMDGTRSKAAANYGNYTYSDGSVMVWIPKFYYRIGSASSPRYAVHGVNAIDILPASAFIDVAAANADGYALHRAFWDNGLRQPGFFVDKYQCSNNGGIASSIALGAPLSTSSAHNPIGALPGVPGNYYGACFDAAKTRGAQFFPAMRYMHAALALLSQAHAQAATGPTYCAWYSASSTNFPKGNNVSAGLRDANDVDVTFTSDGYASGSSALTGSGVPFAKTTHNGQACGVADLNGNMYEVSPGLTCFTTAKAITGATAANPVQITAVAHGFATGDIIQLTSLGGITQLNSNLFKITVTGADTFTLNGVDGTGFAAYTSGGSATRGDYYALNTSAKAADLTSGTTLATDQWSAAGVAAHSSLLAVPWRTDYPNNGYAQRYGNAANAVLPNATNGEGWMRASLGLALADGVSPAGAAAFGQDYYYQAHVDLLCPRAGGGWANSSAAGVWAVYFYDSRTHSNVNVGFRAASYL